jgi:hypothetical protein
MNILERFNKTTFLNSKEIKWLINDIMGELECSDLKTCADRKLISWFLRNLLYLPYKRIGNDLMYHRIPQAFHAEKSFTQSTDLTFSLSGYEKDKIDMMRQIADEHYDCAGNIYLDRVTDAYLEEALLYKAAVVCGMEDSQSNYNAGHRIHKTPTSSQLVNLSEILAMYEASSDPVDMLDNFELIKND